MSKVAAKNNFDLLRVILASTVVFYHASRLSQVKELNILHYCSGTLAVQAFFVVSGFLVTMSYENSKSLGSYFSKRIRRLFPAYLTAVFLAALLAVFVSDYPGSRYFFCLEFWRYLFFNSFLMNFAAPSLPGVFQNQPFSAVNGSLWTIKIEVAFYLITPVMVTLTRFFGLRRTLIVAFASSVLYKLTFLYLNSITGKEIYGQLSNQVPGQFSYFCAGAILYYYFRKGGSIRWFWAAIGAAAYALLDGYALAIISPIAVSAMVGWFGVTFRYLGRFGKYGDFSYGIYLYHFPIIQTFVHFGLFNQRPWVGVVGLVALVAVTAILSWNLVEKHALPHRRSKPNAGNIVGEQEVIAAPSVPHA